MNSYVIGIVFDSVPTVIVDLFVYTCMYFVTYFPILIIITKIPTRVLSAITVDVDKIKGTICR